MLTPVENWSFTPVLAGLPEAAAGCPASPERMEPHVTSSGKHPNSKFEIWVLLNACCFHIIKKLKTPKSNACKLGTICSSYDAEKPDLNGMHFEVAPKD